MSAPSTNGPEPGDAVRRYVMVGRAEPGDSEPSSAIPKMPIDPSDSNLAPDTPILVAAQLRVRDLERAVRFYRTLGLRPIARWTMQDGQRLVWMRDPRSEQTVELYFVPRRSPLFEPIRRPAKYLPLLLFTTRHSDRLLARLRRRGARLIARFRDQAVQITFLRDSEGNAFEVVGWPNSGPRDSARPMQSLLPPRAVATGTPSIEPAVRGTARRKIERDRAR